MGFQVVDGHERHIPHQGQRLGCAHSHQQRADKAGAGGSGHRLHIVVAETGFDHRLGHHRGEQLHMGPTGDLRDHAAVAGVQIHLAADHRRKNGGGARDHGRRGFVTRGLDAQDDGGSFLRGFQSGHAQSSSTAILMRRSA